MELASRTEPRPPPCHLPRVRGLTACLLALALALALPVPGQAKGPPKSQAQAQGQAGGAVVAPRFTLGELISLALENNRGLAAAADQVEAARAGIATARAFPNPTVEAFAGDLRPRQTGASQGNVQDLWITQPLDYPWQRRPRIGAADAGLDAARSQQQLSRSELLAQLRYRFFELVKREAELRAAREDERTMEQIARRIKLKVDTGESPRFEAIKAETELLSARKVVQSAALRIRQTRASLRQLVGAVLPAEFAVEGSLEATAPVPSLEDLRGELLANNPELARNRALTRQAENQRDYEKSQRWPALSIKGGVDLTPEHRDTRIGVVVTVPLWDRRGGPIAEAEARLSKARNEEALQEFTLQQSLETAWQQWLIASDQVKALESGIIRQAEAALRVAENAYRAGERGILEFLDAQRVYRSARNELIAARFDQQVAIIEIDRLRALHADRIAEEGIAR